MLTKITSFLEIYLLIPQRDHLIFLINLKTNKVLKKEFLTNRTNIIEIDNDLIHSEIFFVTSDYLGVPIYLTEKNGHLSFEHTHPPHEYFMSKNKFKIIKEFKNEISKIIY